MLISWHDLAVAPPIEHPFVIDPYIPRAGITFLHGKSSHGKSPLFWEVARCVGEEGASFFGCPTITGRVLFIEVDGPMSTIKYRFDETGIPPANNVWFLFAKPFNILDLKDKSTRLFTDELKRGLDAMGSAPDLAIINTLRKVYYGDEKDGAIPSRVYGTFQSLLPTSPLAFAGHDKKTPRLEKGGKAGEEREAFSGHQAWLNDAQVVLHLRPMTTRPNDPLQSIGCRLVQTKSQVASPQDDLELILHDGWRWELLQPKAALERALQDTAHIPSLMQRRQAIAQALGVSAKTVQRHLAAGKIRLDKAA